MRSLLCVVGRNPLRFSVPAQEARDNRHRRALPSRRSVVCCPTASVPGGLAMTDTPFRQLPAVNDVLALPVIQTLTREHPHDLVVAAIRQEIAGLRRRLSKGEAIDGHSGAETVAARVADRLGRELR